MPSPPLPVLRRTTLTAAPLLLGLTACRWTSDDGSSGADEPDEPPVPEDDDQVTAAIDALRTADAVLVAVESAHPSLAPALVPLLALHAEHLKLLDTPEQEEPDKSDPEQQPGDDPLIEVDDEPVEARAQVVTAERALQDALAELAGEVTSGQLARVLAAMAAGVAQHVIALPPIEEDEES